MSGQVFFKKSWLLIGSTFLFAINQAIERVGIHLKWINSYLDDLLCMPIVLGLALLIFKSFKGKSYSFPISFIALGTIYVGIMAEFVFPRYSQAFTYDPFDFLAYAMGACLFFFWGNKSW